LPRYSPRLAELQWPPQWGHLEGLESPSSLGLFHGKSDHKIFELDDGSIPPFFSETSESVGKIEDVF